MNTNQGKVISDRGLRRLPVILGYLRDLRRAGEKTVSCTPLAEHIGCDATQIRKDLAACGAVGKPRTGYDVEELLRLIEDFLGWNNTTEAFLAGAGNLGSALLGFEKFRQQQGLDIVAAFDTDPDKIGSEIYGREVLPLHKLPDLARRMRILIGIVAVPGTSAQQVADAMIAGGIRAIWNFSPKNVQVPVHTVIEHANLSVSLGVLTAKLHQLLGDSRADSSSTRS